MGSPQLEPISDDDLPEFGRFLNENLNGSIAPEAWVAAFQQDWGPEKPNNGFLIRDKGRIVGGIGAIYAERLLDGKTERFCNITSWCVLEDYRLQSMRLAMALTSQPGFHFTDLTPTQVVSKTLQFLKFKPMNERQAVWPNLPWPLGFLTRTSVITDPGEIERVLSTNDAKAYRDHKHLPWLCHLAVGHNEGFCHVVYKKTRLKGVPGAHLLAVSDPEKLLAHRHSLGNYLLFRHGLLFSRIESRLLPRVPRLSIELAGFRNKVYRSDTLSDADISNLYTELVALDL